MYPQHIRSYPVLEKNKICISDEKAILVIAYMQNITKEGGAYRIFNIKECTIQGLQMHLLQNIAIMNYYKIRE